MKPLTPLRCSPASCFIHCFPAAVERGVSLWWWGYCWLVRLCGEILFIYFQLSLRGGGKAGTAETCVLLFPSALISRGCVSRAKDPPATSFHGPTNLMRSSPSLPCVTAPCCEPAVPSPDSGRDDVKGNVSELPMPEGTVSPFYRRTLVYYCKVATDCVRRCYVSTDTMKRSKQRGTRNKSPPSVDALTQRAIRSASGIVSREAERFSG